MPSGGDRKFGKLACSRGFLTEEQYREALAIQTDLESCGIATSMDRILYDKGFLSAEQVGVLQDAQKRRLAICSCGNRMNVYKYPPGKTLQCSACRKPFEVPSSIGTSPQPPAGGRDVPPLEEKPTRAGSGRGTPPAEDTSRSSWWAPQDFGFSEGDLVGRCRILEHIGAGGMGVVYKVRHTLLDRIEALKIIRPDISSNRDYRKFFLREAQVSAQLKHRHLTQVYDIIQEDALLAFTMQFIEGESLSSLLKSGPVQPGQALAWTAEMADALSLLHSRKLVHRDIKPANVLIDRENKAILTDFGFAKNFEEAGTSGVSQDDVPMGTPGFMAPEQIDNARFVDHRADIYSLGATLYCMLTGQAPFTGSTALEIFGKVLTQKPPKPSVLNPAVTPPLESLLHDMMRRDRNDRLQDPGEVLARLRRIHNP